MEIKLAIALITNVGKVQKVPKIHKVALYYIFLSFLREYASGILLKYYNRNL